jgi:hypothetical protein
MRSIDDHAVPGCFSGIAIALQRPGDYQGNGVKRAGLAREDAADPDQRMASNQPLFMPLLGIWRHRYPPPGTSSTTFPPA